MPLKLISCDQFLPSAVHPALSTEWCVLSCTLQNSPWLLVSTGRNPSVSTWCTRTFLPQLPLFVSSVSPQLSLPFLHLLSNSSLLGPAASPTLLQLKSFLNVFFFPPNPVFGGNVSSSLQNSLFPQCFPTSGTYFSCP